MIWGKGGRQANLRGLGADNIMKRTCKIDVEKTRKRKGRGLKKKEV